MNPRIIGAVCDALSNANQSVGLQEFNREIERLERQTESAIELAIDRIRRVDDSDLVRRLRRKIRYLRARE